MGRDRGRGYPSKHLCSQKQTHENRVKAQRSLKNTPDEVKAHRCPQVTPRAMGPLPPGACGPYARSAEDTWPGTGFPCPSQKGIPPTALRAGKSGWFAAAPQPHRVRAACPPHGAATQGWAADGVGTHSFPSPTAHLPPGERGGAGPSTRPGCLLTIRISELGQPARQRQHLCT